MDYEQKFEIFSKTVLEEAVMKKQRILSQVREQISEAKNKIRGNIIKEAESRLRVASEKAEKNKNEIVSRVAMETKRIIVEKREELIEQMKLSIEKRLINFIDSKEYLDWILLQINDAKIQLNDKNVTVYVGINDEKLINAIIEKSEVKDVRVDEQITYGGCKTVSTAKKMLVDSTFENKLEEVFLNFHGLGIRN